MRRAKPDRALALPEPGLERLTGDVGI